jgi:hypothetical protein
LRRIAEAVGFDFHGRIVSLDGVYDCRLNRKAIFNKGMIPNIKPNSRGRKTPKRGRKPLFNHHRQTSLKTAFRTGNPPDFDYA